MPYNLLALLSITSKVLFVMCMLLRALICKLSRNLQDIVTGRHEMGTGSAVEALSQAIQAAERFPNLRVRHCN